MNPMRKWTQGKGYRVPRLGDVNPDNPHPEATTWGIGPWQGEWPTDDHFDP